MAREEQKNNCKCSTKEERISQEYQPEPLINQINMLRKYSLKRNAPKNFPLFTNIIHHKPTPYHKLSLSLFLSLLNKHKNLYLAYNLSASRLAHYY
jgi:hypothetical protein